jgi:hypothetical protein
MYMFRFPDRDIVMRFYWGSAIGHTYAHKQSSHDEHESHPSTTAEDTPCVVSDDILEQDREIDIDDPDVELLLDVRDDDNWDDADEEVVDGGDPHDTLHSDDELFVPVCDTE